jgi:hypothetical protein
LTGRLVDQRSALRRVTIEIGEFLAILALKDQWLAADWRPRLKAREAIIGIGQPVATLGVLAFIDHIGADIALSCHYLSNRPAQRRVVFAVGKISAIGARQAADVGGEYFPTGASLHATCSPERLCPAGLGAMTNSTKSIIGTSPTASRAGLSPGRE